MNESEVVGIIAFIVTIAAAAFLAAAETAITRVSTARAEALVEEGRRGAGACERGENGCSGAHRPSQLPTAQSAADCPVPLAYRCRRRVLACVPPARVTPF